jgi:hypothetical protein
LQTWGTMFLLTAPTCQQEHPSLTKGTGMSAQDAFMFPVLPKIAAEVQSNIRPTLIRPPPNNRAPLVSPLAKLATVA